MRCQENARNGTECDLKAPMSMGQRGKKRRTQLRCTKVRDFCTSESFAGCYKIALPASELLPARPPEYITRGRPPSFEVWNQFVRRAIGTKKLQLVLRVDSEYEILPYVNRRARRSLHPMHASIADTSACHLVLQILAWRPRKVSTLSSAYTTSRYPHVHRVSGAFVM